MINLLTLAKKNMTFSPNNELKQAYLDLQKKQTELFVKNGLCRVCEENCCCFRTNRYDFNDCYVLGFSLKTGISKWYTILNLFKTFPQAVIYLLKKGKKSFQPEEYCDQLSKTGCALKVGERPNYCTSYFCYKFAMAISRDDARTLSYLTNQDFWLQNKISFLLIRDIILSTFKHEAKKPLINNEAVPIEKN
jgi:hypothetical protein